jgi:enoyl-CoA hydratase
MSDVLLRIEGRAGRITLNRPHALNAVTYAMCRDIEAALDRWYDNPTVMIVLIDATGDRAFSAGGDIAELYATGKAGNYDFGRQFWRDEYRLNAKLFRYPKPVVSFLQGFTMGGGVGIGCLSHRRIVGESSLIAMPECSIGLVPDVGGSMLLARAPGRIGAYLGMTGTRMGPDDAILAGFADAFISENRWVEVKKVICDTGQADLAHGVPPPPGKLRGMSEVIDNLFDAGDIGELRERLQSDPGVFSKATLASLDRCAPLSLACTMEILRRLGPAPEIEAALELEYRFSWRAMEHGDFLEGVRAAIIDKDRNPRWQHDQPPPRKQVLEMLAPLGKYELNLGEEKKK